MNKPAFDPSQSFSAADSKPEFDPSKPFDEVKSDPKTNGAQAGLEAFGNTVSGGFLPQVQAATYPLTQWVLNKVTGQNVDDGKSYVQRRDDNIKRMDMQNQEHPGAVAAGEVAGLGAGMMLPLGKLTAAETLLPSLKGAQEAKSITQAYNAVGRLGQSAIAGAGIAGAQNPGDVEGEVNPLQIGDRLGNAKTGAMLGPLAELSFAGLGKGANMLANAPDSLKAFAEKRAFKSLEPTGADFKNLSMDDIRKTGRVLLDEGVIKPGASLGDIVGAAKNIEETKGPIIGQGISQIAQHEAETNAPKLTRAEIATNLRQKLLTPEIPGLQSENPDYEKLISNFEKGGKDLGVQEIRDMQQAVAGNKKQKGFVNWKAPPGSSPDQEFYKALNGELIGNLESKVESLGGAAGLTDFVKQKQAFSAARKAGEMASVAEKRELKNNFLSQGDMMTGIGGAAIGAMGGETAGDKLKGAAEGLLAGAAHHFLKKNANPLITNLADAVANRMSTVGSLGKFTAPIVEAAEKGPAAYGATLINFMNDPKFIQAAGLPNKDSADMSSESAVQRRMKQIK